ncbi:DNA-dependent metalloprotease WSS1, partial [Tremellales sp. Uapishka_1]
MSLVGRYEHLPNRPLSNEARPLLEKIASQVKPIMKKRDWTVGTLAEFLPSNPALLGSSGPKARITPLIINESLRQQHERCSSWSCCTRYDDIRFLRALLTIEIMELTHIQFGPHDASFYKLLAELEEEFYELKRKGYSGEGFNSNGHHVTGLKLDEYHGKLKGLAAAEQRLARQRVIGKGGVLGGSKTGGRSMREIVAEAAERRIKDDKACDSGHGESVEAEVRRAQEESVGIDASDISSDDSIILVDGPSIPKKKKPTSTDAHPTPSTSTTQRPAHPPSTSHPSSKSNTQPSSLPKPPKSSTPTKPHNPVQTAWSCPTCTLLNPIHTLACEACTTARPVEAIQNSSDGWFCDFCGAGPRELSFWSCAECGWVRKWG